MITSILVRCVLCLLIGLGAFFYLLENDTSFKQFLEKELKNIFAESFAARLEGTIVKVNIVYGYLELHDVSAYALHDDSWEWHAKKFTVRFSWLTTFLKQQFDLIIGLDVVHATSLLKNNEICIIDHLRRLIGGKPGFPVSLKSLQVKKGDFALYVPDNDIRYTTQFTLYAATTNDSASIHLYGVQGAIEQAQKKWCQEWSCTANVVIKNFNNPTVMAQLQGSMILPDLEKTKQICCFDGRWHGKEGYFTMNNRDHSWQAIFDHWRYDDAGIHGDATITVPCSYGNACVGLPLSEIDGSVHGQVHMLFDDALSMDGLLQLQDVSYKNCALGTMSMTFSHEQNNWHGLMHYALAEKIVAEGTWHVDSQTQQGELHLHNACLFSNTSLPYTIKPGAASMHIHCNGLQEYSAQYDCTAMHETQFLPLELQGIAQGDQHNFVMTGSFNTTTFSLATHFTSTTTFLTLSCLDAKGKEVLRCVSDNDNPHHITGMLDYHLLQEYVALFTGNKIPGEGILSFDGAVRASSMLINIAMKESNIRIPNTYNLIRGLQGTITADLAAKKCIVKHGILELDRGFLECKRAVFTVDDSYTLHFVYVPCTLHKVLVALHKDLFALVSGQLLWTQKKDFPAELQGSLLLDRAYVKQNIFSVTTQQDYFSWLGSSGTSSQEDQMPTTIDLLIQTKDPLQVKTSFLDANALLNIAIQGTVQNPRVAGSLTVERGTLAFPYKPLTITRGIIYFLPNQLLDPAVELIAQGTIRKYQVTLRCSGFLQNPHISFESTPPLTEEQIITLLLAGSEEGSISLVMPTVIMQSMQNVLFGPEQSSSKLERYFKSLLDPLKHIRFVPKFFDPQGRGGFRGAIEVEVNDQLRGMIQRNFSLPEDIKLEVEYFISDDVAVRGMRDERGDFGGEIEMRWKF